MHFKSLAFLAAAALSATTSAVAVSASDPVAAPEPDAAAASPSPTPTSTPISTRHFWAELVGHKNKDHPEESKCSVEFDMPEFDCTGGAPTSKFFYDKEKDVCYVKNLREYWSEDRDPKTKGQVESLPNICGFGKAELMVSYDLKNFTVLWTGSDVSINAQFQFPIHEFNGWTGTQPMSVEAQSGFIH